MRLVTVKAPLGAGKKMAETAFTCDITEVSLGVQTFLSPKKESTVKESFEFMTTTNNAKLFIERLMDASFYDPDKFSFTTRYPESIFANEPLEKETQ